MTKNLKKDLTQEAPKTETLDVLKEVLALKEELSKLKEENKRFSKAEQDAIEAAREEMITDEELGPCYIDEKYKEEGYVYRLVDTTRPGRVQSLIKRGYEIVYDDNLKIGDNKVSNSGSLNGAVTGELGTNRSCLGVLMRITKEQYDRRQKVKERRTNEATEAALGQASNGAAFGEITIGDQTHFKK